MATQRLDHSAFPKLSATVARATTINKLPVEAGFISIPAAVPLRRKDTIHASGPRPLISATFISRRKLGSHGRAALGFWVTYLVGILAVDSTFTGVEGAKVEIPGKIEVDLFLKFPGGQDAVVDQVDENAPPCPAIVVGEQRVQIFRSEVVFAIFSIVFNRSLGLLAARGDSKARRRRYWRAIAHIGD